jgi:alcohol dehydrogenase class IV
MIDFHFARTPAIHFGRGRLKDLSAILTEKGVGKLVLITGGTSFRSSNHWELLHTTLRENRIEYIDFRVESEPSPEIVDGITREAHKYGPEAVVSIGGGSVVDTGKAVSAMLHAEGSVQDYLEGVGTKTPPGEKRFFIAVPTTAGTGTEASKNAVVSKTGEGGFKKSLRHDNYVPDVALIDPELALSCPADITAASGLDAVTQLIESFVSSKATPISDTIAISGLLAAGEGFDRAVTSGEEDLEARSNMAYAACLSGITMANAGLGIVHGLASAVGGLVPIPHGVVCGTLLPKATEVIIERLFDLEEENNGALIKYAETGKYLIRSDFGGVEQNCSALIGKLKDWIEQYNIPRLGSYGVSEENLQYILEKTGRKNTPVDLSKDDLLEIVSDRL